MIEQNGAPVAPMRDGDGIVLFNFRADRMRQIVRALTDPKFDGFDVAARPKIELATMTMYDETFTLPVAFPPITLARIVAEEVSARDMTMFRTAETEKYAHVTYFFNGGYETPYKGEVRELVPSQQVATYDLAPEMSAAGVTDVLCAAIASREHDFILVNYANGDMVGHTGVIPAAIKAVETVDACLARVIDAAAKSGGPRAHHGRPRQLRNDDRSGDRRAAYGPHDEPRTHYRCRPRWRAETARRRRAERCRADHSVDAGHRPAGGNDRRRP